MPTIKVQLPDGQVVQMKVGEDSPPEGIPEKLERGGKSLAAGVGQTLVGGLDLMTAPFHWLQKKLVDALPEGTAKTNLGMMTPPEPPFRGLLRDVQALGNEGIQQPHLRRAVEAGAGGMPFGPVPAIANTLSAPVGEEVGNRFGPVAGALTDVGLSTLLGFGMSPRGFSTADQRLKDASRGMTPQDFAEGQRNAGRFQAQGVQTATLPETIPGNNSLLALANETRAAKGGEKLAVKVSRREEDLAGLSERALARELGPRVDTAAVSGKVEDLAGKYLTGIKERISAVLGKDLKALPDLTPGQADFVRQRILAKAEDVSLPTSDREAFAKMAKLLGNDDWAQRNLQTLSLDVRTGGKQAAALNAQGASNINRTAWEKAKNEVETLIGGFRPGYRDAQDAYKASMQSAYNPELEGSMGKIAGMRPSVIGPDDPNRVSAIVTKQSPETIPATIEKLRGVDAAVGPSNIQQQIARAITQEQMAKGSSNPSAVFRGQPGSLAGERTNALIEAGGGNPARFNESLDVADLLQNFKGLQGTTNDLPQSKMSFLAQPFASLKYMFNQAAREKDYQRIADILSDPNKLGELRKIAMFDPQVRKDLTMAATALGITRQDR